MAIQIKSINQILGDMVRKVVADTALNDLNAGSVLLTLLEAAAANDFENNTAILNVLELLNIDAIKNNDLDAKAADFGLSRNPAIKASGLVTIYNTNITKRSTNLYIIKPAPIAGQTKIYVNSTAGWASSGTLYIGRGTANFEGPIAYSSITVFPTYSEITLSSALQKDHLISDIIIDSQGEPDRVISAGTSVKIPANSQNPEIQYITLRDAVIPSGEDNVTGVEVIAVVPGSSGNASINTITEFDTLPFIGAAVSNTSSFSNGQDIETDVQLRNRLKSYAITLARGTAPSIISSVIGVSDPDDSKQVASAVLTEPVKNGDPSLIYIDDGSGFQPSYTGQSVDLLLANALGTEEFLQLANFPLPRPQVINVVEGPFTLKDGSFLRVSVDGIEETIFFTGAQFLNITSATAAEIIVAINDASTLFKARFTDNSAHMLLYPVAHNAEIIQVAPQRDSDDPTLYANSLFKFPTNEFSYISLYQNNERLREKEKNAEVTTVAFAQWNITGPGNIIISVDGTPAQDRSFTLSDFPGAASFSNLTLAEWVTAFNNKFAGLTAEATPSETMKIVSNKGGSESSISIVGGTILNKWFPDGIEMSVGQTAQFELNRQTGNLRILTDIKPGDTISAGIEDAKGYSLTAATTSGTYNFSVDGDGRSSDIVLVVDSTQCDQISVPLPIGSSIDITNPSGDTMRIMSSALISFADLSPGDFVYITNKTSGWVNNANSGLYKIVAKGGHTTAGTDTFIDVLNLGVVPESGIAVADSQDIKGFKTDGYPQIWRAAYLSNPPAATISDVATSLNKDVAGVLASIYRSNSIKLSSNTENGGSIAIPVVNGNASTVFTETISAEFGTESHIATRVSDKSLVSMFKRTNPSNTNVWLGRHVYSDIKGSLSSSAAPDPSPFTGTYSESVSSTGVLTPSNVSFDDYVSFTRGNNRGQFRSVKAKLPSDTVGTQQGVARTELDHIIGDEVELVKPISLSSDDNIVVIMDKDASVKTINVKMARTGKVNSGSGPGSFLPTTTEFSADDSDNEPGIDFSDLTVWGTSSNGTNFSDYAVWTKARNWYSTGGVAGTDGKMLVRAAQFGPNGEKLRFAIGYPDNVNQDPSVSFNNTPSWSLLTYFFGAGNARPTALAPGDTISVTGPYPDSSTNFPSGAASTGNYYDYTFSAGNFAPVVVGDVMTINAGSGVSASNSGQFRITNKSLTTVRVFNPNGSATAPGAAEVTTITTVQDVVGTPTSYDITTSADVAGSLDQKYFIINDSIGSVAVWIDLNNAGNPAPIHGANRAIKVSTINTNDSANNVAAKIGTAIQLDNAFSVMVTLNTITVINQINGNFPAGSSGTSGFPVVKTAGTPDITIDGKYFILYDLAGSVAFWYDTDNGGTPEPFHGADRSVKIGTVASGSSAATVAAATSAAINGDLSFSSSNLSNVITVTNSADGNVPNASAGTSTFTVGSTDGSFATPELITNPNALIIYPLTGTDIQTIMDTVNPGGIIEISPVSATTATIVRSTEEEVYAYGGNSTALAYGHNPTSPSQRDHISLYDSVNWVKSFANTNPNFTLKQAYILNGVAPTMYEMDTAPNFDSAELGEMFKLIPVTVVNIHHHLTQKALSQLPIVSNVRISDDRKNVQITSKNLGSSGAVEVVGGNANKAAAYILGESIVDTDTSGNYLAVKIPAFPDTFNIGDMVKLQNDAGVKRLSRLENTDTIDTTIPSAGLINYNYNPKDINVIAATTFTITDVSGSYGRPSGYVWRWTHGGGATFAEVKAGDLLMAYGSTLSYDQGNKARISGDGEVSGLPIIFVNDASNYLDVVNPYGRAMSSTAVGSGNTVQVCPTPVIKWNLNHAARSAITLMSRSGSTVAVTLNGPHLLHNGDNFDLIDSDNIVDGSYGPITSLSANQFTFTSAGSAFTETNSGASIIKSGLVPTRYRVENTGFNDFIRIVRQDGQSPRFTDCGVAVDDYVILGGSTFSANNSGRYRVSAVDNDSLILINKTATDELNTIVPFNNKGLGANWTANGNTVSGIAGTFKYVNVGDWVKKPEDPDTAYVQVVTMTPSTPALATTITLGDNYSGSTATAPGISYDELVDHDKGVVLQSIDDITIYEGDSVAVGDQLFVQNIIDANWFSVNNIGNFEITEFGTDSTTLKPFVRIANTNGVAEANVNMSVDTEGFYIVESLANKFYTIRQIANTVIDSLNSERRIVYISPFDRSYKFSAANFTSINHMGKLGYNTDVISGIDGYTYYTGLLRTVQRIVDGFEPDIENYPGRRAVGGFIETLPPLIRKITITINVTTDEGVNLGDITNNIKSVIINYIDTLGVGQDVILSEIIAAVMNIKGVAAVTFTNPTPSTERIVISDNEKATIAPEDIGIA